MRRFEGWWQNASSRHRKVHIPWCQPPGPRGSARHPNGVCTCCCPATSPGGQRSLFPTRHKAPRPCRLSVAPEAVWVHQLQTHSHMDSHGNGCPGGTGTGKPHCCSLPAYGCSPLLIPNLCASVCASYRVYIHVCASQAQPCFWPKQTLTIC